MLLTPHLLFDQFIDRNAVELKLRELEEKNYESGAAIVQLLTFKNISRSFFVKVHQNRQIPPCACHWDKRFIRSHYIASQNS